MAQHKQFIRRDPFARDELWREQGPSGFTCDWCGQRSPKGRVYKYFTETDGGRRHDHQGVFCSKSCHDTYHN